MGRAVERYYELPQVLLLLLEHEHDDGWKCVLSSRNLSQLTALGRDGDRQLGEDLELEGETRQLAEDVFVVTLGENVG